MLPLKVNQQIERYGKVVIRWELAEIWKKERGPEPRPLLQATILFHLRGHLIKS